MKDKKTVFVLGAGASCPYGYPSGAQLRKQICFDFNNTYPQSLKTLAEDKLSLINGFIHKFCNSHTQSIDLFMARNRKLAPTGKCIIALEIFKAEQRSLFGERAKLTQEWYSRPRSEPRAKDFVQKGYFQGDDWYSYLFNRLTAGLTRPDILPDFSNNKISFITFNYDRSLEHFFYESIRNSFTEVPEDNIVQTISQLKILHVYGQVMPLKWQDSNEGVDYKLEQISELLLQKAASNIKTIYEQRESPEVDEAQRLLSNAERIFFLGFGYAEENLEILKLPDRTKKASWIYGTAYGQEAREISDNRNKIIEWLPAKLSDRVIIENMDCLKLLRNHL